MGNDPAFPVFEEYEKYDDDDGRWRTHMMPVKGLSKREYFAGLAMQGILSSNPTDSTFRLEDTPRRVSERAVECADALLAELAKESKT